MYMENDVVTDYKKLSNRKINTVLRKKIFEIFIHGSVKPDKSTRDKEKSLLADKFNHDPEAFILGGFLDYLGDDYTSVEKEFIRDLAKRFERVALGFAFFTLQKEACRPVEALRLAQDQFRTGFIKAGIPEKKCQSVEDHQVCCKLLARFLYYDDPDIDLIEETALFHDVCEAVTGDFTPHCEISAAEKLQLEKLAIKLIAADGSDLSRKIRRAYRIFEGEDADLAKIRGLAKDCDRLEMILETFFVSDLVSAEDKKDPVKKHIISTNMQEFWDFAEENLKDARARIVFRIFEQGWKNPEMSFAKTLLCLPDMNGGENDFGNTIKQSLRRFKFVNRIIPDFPWQFKMYPD